MNIDEFEVQVRAAVATAKKAGWRIVRHVTLRNSCCCPIGALMLAKYPEMGECFLDGAIRTTGLDFDQALEFAEGFDGASDNTTDSAWTTLGEKLAAEWLP